MCLSVHTRLERPELSDPLEQSCRLSSVGGGTWTLVLERLAQAIQSLSYHLGLHKGKATHCPLPGCLYLPPSRCNRHIFSLHFIFLNKLGTFLEHSTHRWALPFACLQLWRNRQRASVSSERWGMGRGREGFLPATLSFSRLTDPRPVWLIGSTGCVWIRLKRNKQEQNVWPEWTSRSTEGLSANPYV